MAPRAVKAILLWLKNRWKRILFDFALVLAILYAVSLFQTRHLLPSTTKMPVFSLLDLEGNHVESKDLIGHKVVIYFWAPWCSVCHYSIGNLDDLVASDYVAEFKAFAIALDYQSRDSVVQFAADHELGFPVLLGDESISAKFKVSAFPTYYVFNEEGVLTSSTVGYSSIVGLWLRVLW